MGTCGSGSHTHPRSAYALAVADSAAMLAPAAAMAAAGRGSRVRYGSGVWEDAARLAAAAVAAAASQAAAWRMVEGVSESVWLAGAGLLDRRYSTVVADSCTAYKVGYVKLLAPRLQRRQGRSCLEHLNGDARAYHTDIQKVLLSHDQVSSRMANLLAGDCLFAGEHRGCPEHSTQFLRFTVCLKPSRAVTE